jgi:hypothetical protein
LVAEKIWKAIASGEADDSTKLDWVEHVASELVARLIKNSDLDDRLRGLEALNAKGLGGAALTYADLRNHIKMVIDFGELAGFKEAAPSPKEIVRYMKSQGLLEMVLATETHVREPSAKLSS